MLCFWNAAELRKNADIASVGHASWENESKTQCSQMLLEIKTKNLVA